MTSLKRTCPKKAFSDMFSIFLLLISSSHRFEGCSSSQPTRILIFSFPHSNICYQLWHQKSRLSGSVGSIKDLSYANCALQPLRLIPLASNLQSLQTILSKNIFKLHKIKIFKHGIFIKTASFFEKFLCKSIKGR